MKYKWKKQIALSLLVCLFGISVTGCGSSPAAGNEVDAPTKLDAPKPINDETNETKQDEGTDAAQADVTEETENSSADDTDNSADTENTSETSGKWHVNDPDVAAAIDADFEGVVYKIEADSFFITPTETTLMEDGSLEATSFSADAEIPDDDLVQVVFDNNTSFILRDIYDGGASYEDSDASFQNIEKNVSVSLKGDFQNDIFHATAIRITKVH